MISRVSARSWLARRCCSSAPATAPKQTSYIAPRTPPSLPTAAQPLQGDVAVADEYRVSYSYPSRSSNAPRILDSSNVKRIVPFQKTVWSLKAEDILPDSLCEEEAPQSELAVRFARDQVVAVDRELVHIEDALYERHHVPGRLTRLWRSVSRIGQRKTGEDGLLVRDETFWKYHVMDKYGFYAKPKHLTWEQFAEELEDVGMYWEMHPTKPEDFYILHMIRGKGDERRIVWSAEHAAWNPPVFIDLWACLGTMLSRRLKTRTLSFDNGRGTIKELNIRHVSPWTSAVQVNCRPPYYYDPLLRERREENASWYFSKDLIAQPGIDDEGTVSFYTSAQTLTYHLCKATQSLLDRPLWMFYRRGRRRHAEHELAKMRNTPSKMAINAAQSWTGLDSSLAYVWPAENSLDAITDHWLEESPYPLTMVWDTLRRLAKLKPTNLELQNWVGGNKRSTREAGLALVSAYTPQLLLPPGEESPEQLPPSHPANSVLGRAVNRWLTPSEEHAYKKLARSKVYVKPTLPPPESAPADDEAKPTPEGRAGEDEATAGRERMRERLKAEGSAADSEQWEWLHDKGSEGKDGTGTAGKTHEVS